MLLSTIEQAGHYYFQMNYFRIFVKYEMLRNLTMGTTSCAHCQLTITLLSHFNELEKNKKIILIFKKFIKKKNNQYDFNKKNTLIGLMQFSSLC